MKPEQREEEGCRDCEGESVDQDPVQRSREDPEELQHLHDGEPGGRDEARSRGVEPDPGRMVLDRFGILGMARQHFVDVDRGQHDAIGCVCWNGDPSRVHKANAIAARVSLRASACTP